MRIRILATLAVLFIARAVSGQGSNPLVSFLELNEFRDVLKHV